MDYIRDWIIVNVKLDELNIIPYCRSTMSHLADEIDRQMGAFGLNQVQVSERSGISQGQLSKWLRSAQHSISEEQLNALAPALSGGIDDHAALVRAHLLDERFGPGSELVQVEIDSRSAKHGPRPRSAGERALEFLAQERLTNRDLNDLLIDLARCLGGESAVNSPRPAAKTADQIAAIVKKHYPTSKPGLPAKGQK